MGRIKTERLDPKVLCCLCGILIFSSISWAIPIGPGQSFPMPPAEDELNWDTEAQVLETLKRVADTELSKLNSDIVMQTQQHAAEGNLQPGRVISVVFVAGGVAMVWVAVRSRQWQAGTKLGFGITGIVLSALGIFVAGQAEGRSQVQPISLVELREVVGEDVAKNLEALHGWLANVHEVLQTRDLWFEVPVVMDAPDEENVNIWGSLNFLSLEFTDDHTDLICAELKTPAVLPDSEEGLHYWVRLGSDNTPDEVLQKIRLLLEQKILAFVSQQDLVWISTLRRLAPERYPGFLEGLSEMQVPVGLVLETFDFGPQTSNIQRLPSYILSLRSLLQTDTPGIRLPIWRLPIEGPGVLRVW